MALVNNMSASALRLSMEGGLVHRTPSACVNQDGVADPTEQLLQNASM